MGSRLATASQLVLDHVLDRHNLSRWPETLRDHTSQLSAEPWLQPWSSRAGHGARVARYDRDARPP